MSSSTENKRPRYNDDDEKENRNINNNNNINKDTAHSATTKNWMEQGCIVSLITQTINTQKRIKNTLSKSQLALDKITKHQTDKTTPKSLQIKTHISVPQTSTCYTNTHKIIRETEMKIVDELVTHHKTIVANAKIEQETFKTKTTTKIKEIIDKQNEFLRTNDCSMLFDVSSCTDAFFVHLEQIRYRSLLSQSSSSILAVATEKTSAATEMQIDIAEKEIIQEPSSTIADTIKKEIKLQLIALNLNKSILKDNSKGTSNPKTKQDNKTEQKEQKQPQTRAKTQNKKQQSKKKQTKEKPQEQTKRRISFPLDTKTKDHGKRPSRSTNSRSVSPGPVSHSRSRSSRSRSRSRSRSSSTSDSKNWRAPSPRGQSGKQQKKGSSGGR